MFIYIEEGGSMFVYVLFAVVVTTAIFLFFVLKMKQKEIRSTQQLLLQFIDQFEEQHEDLVNQFEQYKQSIDEKYDNLLRMIQSDDIQSIQKQLRMLQDHAYVENTKEVDPLHIKERYKPILQLQQEGKTIEEIARITGKGKGEILLILELIEKQLDR